MAVLANLLRAAGILIAIGILVVGFIGAHIFAGMRQKPEQNLPYVIVLGAQVRGTKVSKALRKRLDCAAEYAKENPDTIFFLSGGQGDGEDITEAEAMQEYLIEAGVDAKRLRMEDRSTTTWENLKFCNELQPLHTERVGILSNDFHIYRAVQMARQQGYEDVCGIITNTINTTGGMVCDGAKSSCASKIATAVGMALLAMDMSEKGRVFKPGEGLVEDNVEETIESVGRMGREGMKSTDVEILKIMLGK